MQCVGNDIYYSRTIGKFIIKSIFLNLKQLLKPIVGKLHYVSV